jgi:hypothetical protein
MSPVSSADISRLVLVRLNENITVVGKLSDVSFNFSMLTASHREQLKYVLL